MVDQRAPSVDDVVDKGARIRKLENDVDNRDAQIFQLEVDIQAQEETTSKLETDVETKGVKIAELESRIENYETDIRGMHRLNAELKSKHEISEKELAKARKEQHDIEELRGLIENHQAESARRDNIIHDLQKERDNSFSQVRDLQSHVDDFKIQVETSEENYGIVQQENEELRDIYDVLKKHFPNASDMDAYRVDELIQDLKFEGGLPLSPKKRDSAEKRQPSLADELAALSEDEELSPEMRTEFETPTEQKKESPFKLSKVFQVSNIEPAPVSPENSDGKAKGAALEFSKIFEAANVEPRSISPDAIGTEAKKATLDFTKIFETANVEPESISPRTIVSSSKGKEATPLKFSRISELANMEPESISPRTVVNTGKTKDDELLGLSQVREVVDIEPEEATLSTAVKDRKRKPLSLRFSRISALSTQDEKASASRKGASGTSERKPVQSVNDVTAKKSPRKSIVRPSPPTPSSNPANRTTTSPAHSRPTKKSPQWQHQLPKLLMFLLTLLSSFFLALILLLTGFYFGDYPWSYANGYTDATLFFYVTGGVFGGVLRGLGNAVFGFLKPQLETWAREAYVGGLPG